VGVRGGLNGLGGHEAEEEGLGAVHPCANLNLSRVEKYCHDRQRACIRQECPSFRCIKRVRSGQQIDVTASRRHNVPLAAISLHGEYSSASSAEYFTTFEECAQTPSKRDCRRTFRLTIGGKDSKSGSTVGDFMAPVMATAQASEC